MGTGLTDHVQIEGEVVFAGYHSRKHLPRYEKMPQVGLRICVIHK